jgi:hypothetical protein
MKKIAFLFLIYDRFNCPELWERFFEGVDPSKYTIIIHYKWQVDLGIFEKYKLKNCIETQYAHISLSKAHNLMLAEAIKDPLVYKTINVSQACIPFKSFDHIYEKLTENNESHFNVMPMSDWSISVTWCARHFIPGEEIHKAAEWFILNREHITCVLNHPEYITYFEGAQAPEEFLYLSLLRKFCPEHITTTNYSAECATTFTNWNPEWGMVYKYPVDASIKNYSTISGEELQYLKDSPCFFGRKFNGGCTVDGVPLHLSTFYN